MLTFRFLYLRVVCSDNFKLSDKFRVNSDLQNRIDSSFNSIDLLTPLITVDEGQFCEIKN